MADKIVQLYDEAGNNIYPATTLDAIHGSGALRADFVLKSGDTMTGPLAATQFIGPLNGNANTATTLATARTLKIGNTGKTFNGGGNVTWSSNEIGFLDLATRGTQIADNTNLNNLGYGNFYSNSSTNSSTMTNAPITSAGFRLYSARGYNSSAGIYEWQFAQTSSRKLFQRFKDSNGNWSTWGHMVMTPSNSAEGSSSLPVYINGNGIATACTASSLFSTLSWTAGSTSGPVLNTTVGGQARTATIPSASASASGIVTTGAQTFAGTKTFSKIQANSTSYPGVHIWGDGEGGNIRIFTKNSTTNCFEFDGYDGNLRLYYSTDGGAGNTGYQFWSWKTDGSFNASKVYGAVWNDYAEYRNQKEIIEPGYCVASSNNGQVYKTTEKFQACDGIVSDTFGFAIGETDECQTPLAVAGRVLAYFHGNREDYHSGDTVCAGPEGKVMKMTREEIKEYPDRIIGIVSEIPEYEIWGSGNVEVNNRIWIKVK